MLVAEQQKFAADIAQLILYINSCGYGVTFGEAYRTPEQAAIYAKEGKGIKNSLHTSRLALDLNLFKENKYLTDPKDYAPFAAFWESLDPKNKSGINFPRGDANHFERRP